MTQVNCFTGLNRDNMPQCASVEDIAEQLDLSEISYSIYLQDPNDLRATQDYIVPAKLESIMEEYRDRMAEIPTIIVSRDNMILDGHHRWAAVKESGFRSITTLAIDLPWKEGLAWLCRPENQNNQEIEG